jgi:hypothetical protein
MEPLEYAGLASEAAFERAVIDMAGYLGWECFHVADARRFWPGWPDWIAFRQAQPGRPGRIIWFELKRTGGELRPNQRLWKLRIEGAGGECYEWRPGDWPSIETVLRGER